MAHDVPSKPWSVAIFEKYRLHLTQFILREVLPLLEEGDCRRIVIRAPVKSGKREMVEYIAVRDYQASSSHRVHVFISAWHRVADEDQREELARHNMKVFSIINEKKVAECLAWIKQKIELGKKIVLHLDECDHGSGEKQMLSLLWKSTRANDKITNILYSATPQEVLFSGELDDDEHRSMVNEMMMEGEKLEYEPPEGYCGPANFLEKGLVHEAIPFFYKEPTGFVLSAQGKEIVENLKEAVKTLEGSKRNIIVLRLSHSDLGGTKNDRKKNKSIYQFLHNLASFPELKDFIVVVDKADDMGGIRAENLSIEKIQWSSKTYWRRQATGIPTIVVIDQTSSRSTEWACHDRIFATHDFRNKIHYTTISQAQERVNHYTQKYGGFQPIKVYGHTKTFQLSAGQIDYADYMTNPWMKRKVDRRTTGDEVLYRIKSTSPGNATHPLYPDMMDETAADRVLQSLACFADSVISARVMGRIKQMPVYESQWHPCTEASWTNFATKANSPLRRLTRKEFQNPFSRSRAEGLVDGKYQGYLRKWGVMDYETQVKPQPGWGVKSDSPRITICYKGGVLGVAVRFDTGRTEQVDTLRAFKSMYAATRN